MTPGAKPAQLAVAEKALGAKIPRRWAEVLGAHDGFRLDESAIFDDGGELRVSSCADLPENHRSTMGMLHHGSATRGKAWLVVADTDIGDAVVLDVGNVTRDGDCPVAWVDHETSGIVQTWPSISLFLKDAVEPVDADG